MGVGNISRSIGSSAIQRSMYSTIPIDNIIYACPDEPITIYWESRDASDMQLIITDLASGNITSEPINNASGLIIKSFRKDCKVMIKSFNKCTASSLEYIVNIMDGNNDEHRAVARINGLCGNYQFKLSELNFSQQIKVKSIKALTPARILDYSTGLWHYCSLDRGYFSGYNHSGSMNFTIEAIGIYGFSTYPKAASLWSFTALVDCSNVPINDKPFTCFDVEFELELTCGQ